MSTTYSTVKLNQSNKRYTGFSSHVVSIVLIYVYHLLLENFPLIRFRTIFACRFIDIEFAGHNIIVCHRRLLKSFAFNRTRAITKQKNLFSLIFLWQMLRRKNALENIKHIQFFLFSNRSFRCYKYLVFVIFSTQKKCYRNEQGLYVGYNIFFWTDTYFLPYRYFNVFVCFFYKLIITK